VASKELPGAEEKLPGQDKFLLRFAPATVPGPTLLKNSHSKSWQEFHRVRMPYKRRSRFWWAFSILRRDRFFKRRGFFNGYSC
jgi:hypothetical protein